MTSDSLQRLKALPNEHKRIYQAYRTQLLRINAVYKPGEDKNYLIAQLQQKTKNELAAAERVRQSATNDIRKRATVRVEATAESRRKVENALSNGWDVLSLAQQLVSENDRAGLSALKAFLPYAARMPGKLPGNAEGATLPGQAHDYSKQIAQALNSINSYEMQILTDSEKRNHSEAREVSISEPILSENELRISKLVDRALLSLSDKEQVNQMYYWQGLPGSSEKQGLFNPNE